MGGTETVRFAPLTFSWIVVAALIRLRAPQRLRATLSLANRSSGSSGMELKLTPVASRMALRMAGAGPSCGNSPMPFGAKAAVLERNFFEEHVDGRHVLGGGHDVVGHLVVGHVAVLQDDLFVERVADALRDAAFDLAGGENRMKDAADFLHGPELFDLGGVGDGVDGDLGDVDGPRVRRDRLRRDTSGRPRRCRAALRSGKARQLRRACCARTFAGGEELLTWRTVPASLPVRGASRSSCCDARSMRRPMTMAVREATVGPLLGTTPVSGGAMMTSS